MHEPEKGAFDFSGRQDLVRFVKTAEDLKLYVILRPSLYICAEWGWRTPAWLLREDNMRLRVYYKPFLRHVREYYDELTPDVTSYDYDALLTEAGDFTEKYGKFCSVISKYTAFPTGKYTTDIRKKAYGKLSFAARIGLMENLKNISEPVTDTFPFCMEKCGQNYGYILYHSTLQHEQNMERIRM